VKMLVRLGGFLVPIVLVLGLYWFLVRFRVEAGDRQPVATLLFTLGLTLAGEFFAYVALPPDIFTEINTSMERLFNQLWPAAILAFFLAANPPQLVTRSGASDAKSKPGQRSPNPKRRAGPSKPAHPPVRLN
jgi:hypothetical protein